MEFSHGACEPDDYENPLEMTFSNEQPVPMRSNVLDRKLVCYVSSFQVSTADWFTCYENIEIFKSNLAQSAAAANWPETFSQTVSMGAEEGFMLLFKIYLQTNFQAASP